MRQRILKATLLALVALAAMSVVGCANKASSVNDVSADHYYDYIPHRDIGAPRGSPQNPDDGAGSLASLLRSLFH